MTQHASLLETGRDVLKPTLVWNIEKGLALTGAEISDALAGRARLFDRMRTFLQSYDVLALPTVQVPPFSIHQEWVEKIDGHPQATYVDWLRSCSRITVTAHPAISIPAGFTPAGLPVGLQLVGRALGEYDVVRAAAAFEATQPVRRPKGI
jgi:amidase